MEWILLKVGEGVSYVCQLLAGQSQVFIVGDCWKKTLMN